MDRKLSTWPFQINLLPSTWRAFPRMRASTPGYLVRTWARPWKFFKAKVTWLRKVKVKVKVTRLRKRWSCPHSLLITRVIFSVTFAQQSPPTKVKQSNHLKTHKYEAENRLLANYLQLSSSTNPGSPEDRSCFFVSFQSHRQRWHPT